MFKGYDKETGKGIYESNFPLGTPKVAKSAHVLTLIQNVWSKEPITLNIKETDGSVRRIEARFDPTYDPNTQTDAGKLMSGKEYGPQKQRRVTLDLAEDWHRIATESTFFESAPEKGKTTETHKGVKQWHYFINDILFQEYGQNDTTPYLFVINVKERDDGNFVYSIAAHK